MTFSEILKRALEKAVNNGYIIPERLNSVLKGIIDEDGFHIDWSMEKDLDIIEFDNGGRIEEETLIVPVRDIIFSHDFAKAFWGDKKVYPNGSNFGICYGACREELENEWIYNWQYHLKQMVLEENPIKYLETFLKTECICLEISGQLNNTQKGKPIPDCCNCDGTGIIQKGKP